MPIANPKVYNRLLEVCVDSIGSALAAEAGGAQRLELCSALSEGGLTPTVGLLDVVREVVALPVHVLIRPRRGDFCYSEAEFSIIKKDIAIIRDRGAQGVVVGMLQPNGEVDRERMLELIELSFPIPVTFHRAFDLCAEPFKALDMLLQLGIQRLLTSGQQASALQGAGLLAQLRAQAGDAMVIMPGSGIDRSNLRALLEATGAHEFHASARSKVSSSMLYRNANVAMGSPESPSEYEVLQADELHIRELVQILKSAPLSIGN